MALPEIDPATSPVLLPTRSAPLELHPQAELDVKAIADEYGTNLISVADILAKQDGANQVQSGHIARATALLHGNVGSSKRKDALLLLGGALSGAFVQGFIESVSNGYKWRTVIYVFLGVLGMITSFVGIQKR